MSAKNLYKQACEFEKSENKKEAIQAYKQVITEYPNTQEAKDASINLVELSGSTPAQNDEPEIIPQPIKIQSNYNTGMLTFSSVVAWVVFISGMLIIITGAIKDMNVLFISVGLNNIVTGLLLIVFTQLTKVNIDTANNTREIYNFTHKLNKPV